MKSIDTAKRPLKWIISHSIFMMPLLLLLVVTNMLVSVCSVGFSLLSGNVINIASHSSSGSLVTEGIKLGGIIVIEIILRVVNSRMNVAFGGKLEMRLRENIFSDVCGKKWSEITLYHSGEIVNRVRSDASVVASGIMHILPNGVMLLTKIVLALIVLFKIDAEFALILCIVSPILLLIGRVYSKKMKFFHKEVQKSEGSAMSYMLENIQNMTVIKAFENEENISKTLHNLQNETLYLRLKRNAWNIVANVSMIVLFTGGYAFSILWGAYRLSCNMLSFGDFTAMIQLVGQVQSPFKSMGSLLVNYQNMLASAERIMELEELRNDFAQGKRIKNDSFNFDEIVFDNVSFSYGGEDVLKNASATVKKGEFVTLSGISGAGKSTLIRLLLNLVDPDCGSIYLKGDSICPVDSSTRRFFGYVPQGNLLISGTIADNIAFYSDASQEDIEKAARIAQLDFAFDLPDGLNTVLGEKGSGLSEGQIQRIAIARALVRKAPILLLDEATSALDEDTEIRFLDALKKDKSTTVIIITHRKRVFDYCDKIITLSNGLLTEKKTED